MSPYAGLDYHSDHTSIPGLSPQWDSLEVFLDSLNYSLASFAVRVSEVKELLPRAPGKQDLIPSSPLTTQSRLHCSYLAVSAGSPDTSSRLVSGPPRNQGPRPHAIVDRPEILNSQL